MGGQKKRATTHALCTCTGSRLVSLKQRQVEKGRSNFGTPACFIFAANDP